MVLDETCEKELGRLRREMEAWAGTSSTTTYPQIRRGYGRIRGAHNDTVHDVFAQRSTRSLAKPTAPSKRALPTRKADEEKHVRSRSAPPPLDGDTAPSYTEDNTKEKRDRALLQAGNTSGTPAFSRQSKRSNAACLAHSRGTIARNGMPDHVLPDRTKALQHSSALVYESVRPSNAWVSDITFVDPQDAQRSLQPGEPKRWLSLIRDTERRKAHKQWLRASRAARDALSPWK